MVEYVQASRGDPSQPCTARAVSQPGVELDEAVDLQQAGGRCTSSSLS